MQQETGNHRLRPFKIALRQANTEDGSTYARALEPFPDPFG
jgi:hypothetical protein